MMIDDEMFELYIPGTTCPAFISEDKIAEYKLLFISTIDQLEIDYNNGLFKNNPVWAQSFANQLENIEDSINFLLLHDGIHFGVMMALKKLV